MKAGVKRIAPNGPCGAIPARIDVATSARFGRFVYIAFIQGVAPFGAYFRIGKVYENVPGHVECPEFGSFPSYEMAHARATIENRLRKLDVDEVLRILNSATR